ncbi:MAG TPA: NAD(P)H-binding protein [Ktedonobacterales bacterium]
MILVTGAGGFAGSRIMSRLVSDGERPRGLVRAPGGAAPRLPASGYDLFVGDTTRPDSLDPALQGVETVIHTAFITADRKQGPGVNYHETNVNGTRNLVEAAQAAGVKRIVVLSGLGTRHDKPSSYMEGRYEANELVKRSGLAWSILGPSIQFGKGAAIFKGLADLIKGMPIITPMIGNGKVEFQPIWVDDVVTCLLKMVREPASYDGQVIDVGGPEIFTYAQLLDMIAARLNKHRIKVPGPIPLATIGAGLMELVLPKPPITRAAIGLFEFPNRTDLDVVQRRFGFQPVSLRDWMAQNGVA